MASCQDDRRTTHHTTLLTFGLDLPRMDNAILYQFNNFSIGLMTTPQSNDQRRSPPIIENYMGKPWSNAPTIYQTFAIQPNGRRLVLKPTSPPQSHSLLYLHYPLVDIPLILIKDGTDHEFCTRVQRRLNSELLGPQAPADQKLDQADQSRTALTTRPTYPLVIHFTPSSSLVEYNWDRPGHLIFYLLCHPEERLKILQTIWEKSDEPHQPFKVCHHLLPKGILLYSTTEDSTFVGVLRGLFIQHEQVLLLLPKEDPVPQAPHRVLGNFFAILLE